MKKSDNLVPMTKEDISDDEIREAAVLAMGFHSGMMKILDYLGIQALKLLFIIIAANFIMFFSGYFTGAYDRDDTDFPDSRSNMNSYIDAKTGCEYLSTQGGSLTPRLDKEGNQICQ